jgi:D-alanyl-lipoteichoic acid acyltransferase DltB (MBOAT superfamily)
MFASSVADYGFALALEKTKTKNRRKLIVAASCVFNLSLLGFFKYFNFFSESARAFCEMLGWHADLVTINVILPVGISFYTFQSMSYLIDVYRGQIQPTRSLLDYMTYVAFFPQLVAGPIERGTHLLPQVLNPRQFDHAFAVEGLRLMLWGFFKKMAVADNMAPFVDQAYGDPTAFSGIKLAFATVAFAFQIYCDFSGYSDIAIGTARLFGFSVMRNFAYPYFSQSIAEFWRRWHISLSTWFRDYLYVPLGGSRVAPPRQSFNLFTTFVVSGLWHGANWTYVAWGALNGLGLILSRFIKEPKRVTVTDVPGGDGRLPCLKVLLNMLITFLFICVTWVFFRARSLHEAFLILKRIIIYPFQNTASFEANLTTKAAVVLLVVFVLVEWLQRRHWHPIQLQSQPKIFRWLMYTCLVWLTLYLAPLQRGGFIYFQF